MSSKTSLSISSRRAKIRLTPDQERFRYLIAQIETVRKARDASEATIARFRTEHSQRLQPLRASLRDLSRDTVVQIDRMLDDASWSRVDRAALREILLATADALLAATPDDADLKNLFDKHSDTAFDAVKQEEMQRLKDEAEELTGFDFGDDDDIRSEEDLIQRMYEHMAQREAEEEADETQRSQQRRESATQKRLQAGAQLVRQSLRSIYRKLASALHPDRESDSQRREEKNVLMQRINQAYAANDLLALFEIQVQIGQSDPDSLAQVSEPQLKQYNKLLGQQLRDAKEAIRELETAFRMDYGLDPGAALTPQKLNLATQRLGRALRAEINRQKEFVALLSNKPATKRWLKDQRRFGSDL